MAGSPVLGWVLILVLALGAGFVGGAILLHWQSRRLLVRSTKYLLDRLKVAETDFARLTEDQAVLTEYLRRRGLLDDEDLLALRRELIELPRQLEAERNELLKEAVEKGEEERIVKNVPDIYH